MRFNFSRGWFLATLLAVCAPQVAAAQAWLAPKGEGSVSLTYEGTYSRDHLDKYGHPYDKGQVTRHSLVTGVEFGLSDRWAIDAKLAGVVTRHTGADAGHGPLDNGRYHGTIQDVRASVSYQMPSWRGWAIAPYAGGILPTHAYETRGHSGFGRRLKSLLVGTWVGHSLDPVLKNAYIEGHYGFSFVAPINGIRVNRSLVDLEAGYSPRRSVTVTVATSFQQSHGGLEFPRSHEEVEEDFDIHDRVARDSYLLLSAGMTVSVGSRTSIYGTVVRTMWGVNTHKILGGTFGISWSFGGGLSLGGRPRP
jgi:hypothetical protein